jgi:hypothetical protein
MDLRGSTIGQALLWPFVVVELAGASEALCEARDGRIVFQVEVFIRA